MRSLDKQINVKMLNDQYSMYTQINENIDDGESPKSGKVTFTAGIEHKTVR